MTVAHRIKTDPTERAYHFIVEQDVQPILENNHALRAADGKRGDFRHKWNLPNVMVAKSYNEYTLGEMRPMNDDFWRFVDKRIMGDPDFAKFKTASYSFSMGYDK